MSAKQLREDVESPRFQREHGELIRIRPYGPDPEALLVTTEVADWVVRWVANRPLAKLACGTCLTELNGSLCECTAAETETEDD